MQTDHTSSSVEEKNLRQEPSKSMFPLSQLSSGRYLPSEEFGAEYRINEALKLNAQRLVGLSQKKKNSHAAFFTKPQSKDRSATIYRISYGEDAIPKAAEADYKSAMLKTKPFIPPEYKEYVNKPHQLPLFLKEQLYKTVKTKRQITAVTEETQMGPTDSVGDNNSSSAYMQGKTEFLPALASGRYGNTHSLSHKDFARIPLGTVNSFKSVELPDYPYLSPKARQQMKSDSVPILMSNVFLTGAINPEGLAPADEAAVEYIISEYHSKTKPNLPSNKTTLQPIEKLPKSKLNKTNVALSLVEQNRRKKEGENILRRSGVQNGIEKVGTKLKATVGHLRMERENKRKKILGLLKTKNFNLFRPNTINNLHLLKDALWKEETEA